MTTITLPDIPKKRSIALILSPVGILLLSAARLIIVADYNTTTAVTIASSGGYINAFLGSVIPLIPVFAPYFALALLLFKRFLLSVVVFTFAAFITPTAISLSQLHGLAVTDGRQLLADWRHFVLYFQGGWQLASIFAIILVAVAIIGPFWVYHRSVAEVASAVAVILVTVGILFATPHELPYLPAAFRKANSGEGRSEHQIVAFATSYWPLVIGLGIALIILMSNYSSLPNVLPTAVAVVATFALFPYVYNIYPFPHHGNYYSEVLHELWQPAEKIVTNSGHVYYGYILSSDPTWDTVLLTSRTIVYVQAGEVVHRSVCLPKSSPQPAPYPPLIPLLYSPPTSTPACISDFGPTSIASILSKGQSLRAISSSLHVWPGHIIYVTNAHDHEHISPALRAYERRRDWNAPTPIGQKFWYYPFLAH